MSLTDVFGGAPEKKVEKNSTLINPFDDGLPPPADALEISARKLAEVHDRLRAKTAERDARKHKLLEEVKQKLSSLNEEIDDVYAAYKLHRAVLRTEMEKAKLNEIPMRDRPPIYIKTVRGSKKSITKTFLCSSEGLGKQAGEALWKRVPRNEDRQELVVPEPYDDQPSD